MSTVATRTLADVDDDELIAIALEKLAPPTQVTYTRYLQDYARYRGAKSIGAALRELIGEKPERANGWLADYRADLEKRGLAPRSIESRPITLRSCVRQLRRAGLTTLQVERVRSRSLSPKLPSEDDRQGLLKIAACGLGPSATESLVSNLKDYARYRGAKSIGAALRDLAASKPNDANKNVGGFIDYLKARGLATTTISRRLNMFTSALRKLRRAGETSLELDIKVPRIVPPDPIGNLTQRDWSLLLAAAKAWADETEVGLRDLVIILLLYERMLWTREVLSLNLADVDLDARQIVVSGKRLPLNIPTCEAMGKWIQARGPWPGPLLTTHYYRGSDRMNKNTLRQAVRMLGRRARLKLTVKPIDLRRAAIARAIDLGLSPKDVKELARTRTSTGRGMVDKILANLGNSVDSASLVLSPADRGTAPKLSRKSRKKGPPPSDLAEVIARQSLKRKRLLDTLYDAGPEGLRKAELITKSGIGSAVAMFNSLRKELMPYLFPPDTTRKGTYRFLWPYSWKHILE